MSHPLEKEVKYLLTNIEDRSCTDSRKKIWYEHHDRLRSIDGSACLRLDKVIDANSTTEIAEAPEAFFSQVVQARSGNRQSGTGGIGKQSLPNRVIELATNRNVMPFVDRLDGPCVAFEFRGHREIRKMSSDDFKDWLTGLAWDEDQTAAPRESVETAIRVLRARARQSNPVTLHTRIAFEDGTIWYDLADSEWRAVRVTRDGWEVVETPPILFRRTPVMAPQVMPEKGIDLDAFFSLHNLPEEDSEQLLYKVNKVMAFLPNIPRAVEVLHGPQGCAKSTNQKLTKMLVDPCLPQTIKPSSDQNQAVQDLAHHFLPVYDNVSGDIPRWFSDLISRAVTGEGHEKRALYTDDDVVVYSFKRSPMFNGINIAAALPDMLDRVVVHRLKALRPVSRKTETAIWMEFEKLRAGSLGAVFDALSRAMREKDGVRLPELERMADYCEWGEAVSRALGYDPGAFVIAYKANRKGVNVETLLMSPVGSALISYLDKYGEFVGTASQLLEKLTLMAEELRIDTKARRWPKAPSPLSRQVNEIRQNVESEEYAFDCLELEKALKDERYEPQKKRLQTMECSRNTKVYYIRPRPTESNAATTANAATNAATKSQTEGRCHSVTAQRQIAFSSDVKGVATGREGLTRSAVTSLQTPFVPDAGTPERRVDCNPATTTMAPLQVKTEEFNKRVSSLQRRACVGGYEHEVAILRRSIETVAEMKRVGEAPSAFILRRNLTREFHRDVGAVDSIVGQHYAEVAKLGILLAELKPEDGK